MESAPFLFEEMNDTAPPRNSPRRRRPSLPPNVQAALAGLEQTLKAIPRQEWEVRRRRWDDLQRDLKNRPLSPASPETVRRRSAALEPSPRSRR